MNKIRQLLSVFRELWETWKHPVVVETVLNVKYRASYQHPEEEWFKKDYLCRYCNILKVTQSSREYYRIPVRFCTVFSFLKRFASTLTEVDEVETLLCQVDAEDGILPTLTTVLDRYSFSILLDWFSTYGEKKKEIEGEKVRKYEEWRRMWAY